jgi:hypothetical protein
MSKITKEHRLNDHCHLVDDTDLNNSNNTFELFKSELKSTRLELKSSIDSIKWLLGFLVAVITTVFISGLIALLIKLFM